MVPEWQYYGLYGLFILISIAFCIEAVTITLLRGWRRQVLEEFANHQTCGTPITIPEQPRLMRLLVRTPKVRKATSGFSPKDSQPPVGPLS